MYCIIEKHRTIRKYQKLKEEEREEKKKKNIETK